MSLIKYHERGEFTDIHKHKSQQLAVKWRSYPKSCCKWYFLEDGRNSCAYIWSLYNPSVNEFHTKQNFTKIFHNREVKLWAFRLLQKLYLKLGKNSDIITSSFSENPTQCECFPLFQERQAVLWREMPSDPFIKQYFFTSP